MTDAKVKPRRLDRAAFAIRPLTAQDRPAIEAIAAQVWDGNDYLSDVFDCWLADEDGLFCAGVLHEQVVAVARLAKIGEGQWWLEGLRVDPVHRNLGIGRILHHYMVNACRRDHAPGTLSFSTNGENWAVHKLAGETGFELRAEYAAYGAPALPEYDEARLIQLGPDDAEMAWTCLETLPTFQMGHRVLEDNWHYWPLTQALLTQRLAAGWVYGWLDHAGQTLTGLAILNRSRVPKVEDGLRLYAGFVDAANCDEMRDLAMALRGLAGVQGAAGASWKLPNDPDRLAALVDAGYEQRWKTIVRLYERDLNLLAGRES